MWVGRVGSGSRCCRWGSSFLYRLSAMLFPGSDRACRSDPTGRHKGLPRRCGSLCAWRRSLWTRWCECALRGEVTVCLFPCRGEGGLGEALGESCLLFCR